MKPVLFPGRSLVCLKERNNGPRALSDQLQGPSYFSFKHQVTEESSEV